MKQQPTDKFKTNDPLWNAANVMTEECKAFLEALMEIVKIRLEPGHCYEQAVRMQEIAKAALRRGEG